MKCACGAAATTARQSIVNRELHPVCDVCAESEMEACYKVVGVTVRSVSIAQRARTMEVDGLSR